MRHIKHLTFIAVVVLAAIALSSCGKESPESSNGIIGTWQNLKIEYVFNGEKIGSEDLSGVNYPKMAFGEDGYMETIAEMDGEDSGLPVSVPYYYSSKDKTLTFTFMVFKEVMTVEKLTSSELVLSLDYTRNGALFGGSTVGKAVDTYKGVKIYQYEDDGISAGFCYKAKGKIIPCDKMSEDDIDGTFTGDINGYYDKSTAYFMRVK